MFDPLKLLPAPQKTLVDTLENFGFIDLLEDIEITVRTQNENNPAKSWQQALEALKNTDRVGAFILGHIHYDVLRAFITGTLTSRASKDPEFNAMLETMYKLEQIPSVYVCVLSRALHVRGGVNRSNSPASTMAGQFHGFGLTIRELQQVLQGFRKYCYIADGRYTDFAKEIDCALTPKSASPFHLSKCILERQWLTSHIVLQVINDWIDKVQFKVVDEAIRNMSEPELNTPLPWCFQIVGWSQEGLYRTTQHLTNKSTTALFGLFQSMLEKLFPGVFTLKQYAINVVGLPDHANAAEILCSIVGGSYATGEWYGLNISLAGGLPRNGGRSIDGPHLDRGYERAQAIIAKSTAWKMNKVIYDEIQDRFRKDVDLCIANRDQIAEISRLGKVNMRMELMLAKRSEDAHREVNAELDDLIDRLKTVLAEVAEEAHGGEQNQTMSDPVEDEHPADEELDRRLFDLLADDHDNDDRKVGFEIDFDLEDSPYNSDIGVNSDSPKNLKRTNSATQSSPRKILVPNTPPSAGFRRRTTK